MRSTQNDRAKLEHARRNTCAAVVNAGLAQSIFTLNPTGNLWPGAPAEASFAFLFPGDIPGRATVRGLLSGELRFKAALWPDEDEFTHGEVTVSFWLERQLGAWVQTPSDWRKTFRCRPERLDQVAAPAVMPQGFSVGGPLA